MPHTPTPPDDLAQELAKDPTILDMAQDLQEALDFGDPMSTWFAEDGTPHGWIVAGASAEYARRTGTTIPGDTVARVLYTVLTGEGN